MKRSRMCAHDGPRLFLPLAVLERIDRLCLAYEEAWRAGLVPDTKSYLSHIRGLERQVLLHELLVLELDHRSRRGETLSVDEYRLRFHDDVSVVDAAFAKVRRLGP